MLYGLLLTLFVIIGLFLVLFVLIQQSKSSLGLGSMGQTQMLFGGSGGQTFFQKITWGMGFTFMLLSFALSIMNSSVYQTRYIKHATGKNQEVVQALPQETTKELDAGVAETTAEASSEQEKPAAA
jgi:preprotein translocase subunit SecG